MNKHSAMILGLLLLLGGFISGAHASPPGALNLTAPERVGAQTCKGSGADRECLYCVTTDGAKSCGWVKVPESTGNAPARGGHNTFLGGPIPDATRQTCTGSGADHKCLYCVTTDGAKSCGWVKVPEKRGSSSGATAPRQIRSAHPPR
jgi:hypothetical protein